MTLRDKLTPLAEMLSGCGKTYHYWHKACTIPAIVWAEDGEDEPFNSDNLKSEQTIHVVIDYFTKTEFDPVVDAIQEGLGKIAGAWKYEDVTYDDGANVIHHTWEVWIG